MSHVTTRNLTTLDFFKCAALICMIIDHVGAYFFPENLWWQVYGRWFGATWYVLVGYARSRDLSPPIWIAGLILVLTNMVVGLFVFPLNSLFTIIGIRLVLDRVAAFAFKTWENLFLTLFVMTLLFLPFSYLVENSTVCLLGGMLGFVVRHMRDHPEDRNGLFGHPKFLPTILWISIVAGTAFQIFAFPFNWVQVLVLIPGFAYGLYAFAYTRMTEYPTLTLWTPTFVVRAIQFMGRYTMELYVGHLVLFKIIACILALTVLSDPGPYGLFQWDWTAAAAYHPEHPYIGSVSK